MTHVSDSLTKILADLRHSRDAIARQAVSRHLGYAWKLYAWDLMISHVEQALARAQTIESKCENFYGD